MAPGVASVVGPLRRSLGWEVAGSGQGRDKVALWSAYQLEREYVCVGGGGRESVQRDLSADNRSHLCCRW